MYPTPLLHLPVPETLNRPLQLPTHEPKMSHTRKRQKNIHKSARPWSHYVNYQEHHEPTPLPTTSYQAQAHKAHNFRHTQDHQAQRAHSPLPTTST